MTNSYAEWRVLCGVAPILREDVASPPEQLLQSIWQHQRLLRDQLTTLDGKNLRVLHPGFRNLEGGPDFRGALLKFDDSPPRGGDVEVDLRPSGWRAHGHDVNPAFKQVILHVLWDSEQTGATQTPTLVLRPVLDAPLGELSLWLGSEAAQRFPEALRGKCGAALRTLSSNRLQDLFHQAAYVRLRSKGAQFQARARQVGWEQSLWEGVFRCLGYKHNVWAMQRLAELRPRWLPALECRNLLSIQARLFGIGGLLPLELTRAKSEVDQYLRQVWDAWWRERDEFSDCILPLGLWRLHGLRPANHPQRRLALAASWSAQNNLPERLEEWCTKDLKRGSLPRSLQETLSVEPDEFWACHCTFRGLKFKKPKPLLGSTRTTDFAVNVVLPWLWIRATEGKSDLIKKSIEDRYFSWPAGQDNSVLRLARHRLLGSASKAILPSAAAQQGLLQIVHDFCGPSNSLCESCRFPEFVEQTQALCRMNSNLDGS